MAEESQSQLPGKHRTLWLMAPILAALYPVLALYGESIRDANVRDAVICGAVVAAVAIAMAYAFRFAFCGALRACLATVAFVAWTFAFSSFLRVGRYAIETLSSTRLNDYILFFLWWILLFAALFLIMRLRWSDRRMKQLYQFVLLACVGSIGIAAFHAARAYLQVNRAISVPVSVWENDQQVMPASWTPGTMTEGRDVYYLLFDRYGSEEALQRYFGFDDSAFYNELEKRGFIVDRKARTSYPMTAPSMASTLNMRYLSPDFGNVSDYFPSMDGNEAGKLFTRAGYEYHFFGNQYDPLRKSSIAQWNMKISMLPCEFADALVTLTPFRPLVGRQHKHRFTMEKFAAVAKLAKDPNLTFTYAHFLVPHPPYAFARDGSAQLEINRATLPEKELYIDQLVATNRLILTLVDELLSESAVKPVIVLQADEGPYLMAGDESLSRDEQIDKRTGILNAILIPDDAIRRRLPKPLMPVNTFRFLFKEYFGAPIDLLPDRVCYWKEAEPVGVAVAGTQIIDVTKDFLPNQ